jgi:RHS repeat-associated protein
MRTRSLRLRNSRGADSGPESFSRLAQTGSADSASYSHSGNGLRAGKTVGTTSNTYTWDDSSVPNLLDDGATDYIYGPDGLPIEQIGSSGSFWYFHDGLGSTVALLGSSGAIAGAYGYNAYGSVTGYTGTATTPLQFAAGYTDAETGFVYLRARYYDPATAEFLTVDPLVDATGAAYIYVNDNPLNLTDPSGDCPGLQDGRRLAARSSSRTPARSGIVCIAVRSDKHAPSELADLVLQVLGT